MFLTNGPAGMPTRIRSLRARLVIAVGHPHQKPAQAESQLWQNEALMSPLMRQRIRLIARVWTGNGTGEITTISSAYAGARRLLFLGDYFVCLKLQGRLVLAYRATIRLCLAEIHQHDTYSLQLKVLYAVLEGFVYSA